MSGKCSKEASVIHMNLAELRSARAKVINGAHGNLEKDVLRN